MHSRIVLSAIFLLASGCGSGGDPTNPNPNPNPDPNPNPSANTITLQAASFSPSTLTVAPGTAVTFVNGTPGITHTITPQGHTQWTRRETATAGEVFTVIINTPGTYNYFCEPHAPGMTGRIIVQ